MGLEGVDVSVDHTPPDSSAASGGLRMTFGAKRKAGGARFGQDNRASILNGKLFPFWLALNEDHIDCAGEQKHLGN